MGDIKVRFSPGDREAVVKKGENLLVAAMEAGVSLNSACGGEGLCGKCKVVIKKGKVKAEISSHIEKGQRKKGYVLACLSSAITDLEVFVPPESRAEVGQASGVYSEIEEASKGKALATETLFEHSPLVRKFYLELPKPTLQDSIGDLDRIYRELESALDSCLIGTSLANVKLLADMLRENDFKITVTVGDKNGVLELLFIEPGDRSKANYGLAFDIGTTTVSGQLIDLNTKKVLGTKITSNKQAVFGSDIITRIVYASSAEGLAELNTAIIENMNEMTRGLSREHNIPISDITAVMVGANMTMLHLLSKIDPTYIRREPYVPTTSAVPTVHASELGLKVNPKGILACIPGVSTYVGGDITAGVIASGLYNGVDLSLLVDIGTNGEIVLGGRDWMIACSASAGPAFEGSGVSCGMRAVDGAIQEVEIDNEFNVKFMTVGAKDPRGICGSGYIDLLCQMLKRALIGRDGRIDLNKDTNRIRRTKRGVEFIVVFKRGSATGEDIVITEEDIEDLKRSKGAIYSAITTLISKMELKQDDLKNIYVAGGFGYFLNIESAISIGLLPDVDRNIFSFLGNTSLVGTRECLLSRQAFSKAKEVAKKITYLDLGSEPKYMDEYVASLFVPHTDLGRFKNIGIEAK